MRGNEIVGEAAITLLTGAPFLPSVAPTKSSVAPLPMCNDCVFFACVLQLERLSAHCCMTLFMYWKMPCVVLAACCIVLHVCYYASGIAAILSMYGCLLTLLLWPISNAPTYSASIHVRLEPQIHDCHRNWKMVIVISCMAILQSRSTILQIVVHVEKGAPVKQRMA